MRGLIVAVLCLGSAGCNPGVFQCSGSDECQSDGELGFCEPNGYCSFEDVDCDSGRRYGSLAGEGLAHDCVPVGETDGEVSGSTSAASTASTLTSGPLPSSSSDPTNVTASSGPETTMPVMTTTPGSESSAGSEGADGATGTTTGPPGPVTVRFGEQLDADYQGVTIDATLSIWEPTFNVGDHYDIHVHGADGTAWEVGLLRFDVSALAGRTVTEAEIHVWSYEADVSDVDIDLHRVLQFWDEGDGDFDPGICNWTVPTPMQVWDEAGAGGASIATPAAATFQLSDPSSRHDIAIEPSVVQAWIDNPDANFGIAFRSPLAVDIVYFASSEEPDDTMRPILQVTYEP